MIFWLYLIPAALAFSLALTGLPPRSTRSLGIAMLCAALWPLALALLLLHAKHRSQ